MRLQKLTKINAPPVLIENETRMIWECAAPIAELTAALKQPELEVRYCVQQIENLEEEYRAAKRSLKTELDTAEAALSQIADEEVRWVTADRARLLWFITQSPTRKEAMLQRYRALHPDDPCTDLVPPVTRKERRVPSPSGNRTRRGRPGKEGSVVVGQETPTKMEPWSFVLLRDASAREYPLARSQKRMLQTLTALLQQQRLAISPVPLLEKLVGLTELPMQQRQSLKHVLGHELHGWKILRLGEYRILLDIDEAQRIIRFLVRHRAEAYDQ